MLTFIVSIGLILFLGCVVGCRLKRMQPADGRGDRPVALETRGTGDRRSPLQQTAHTDFYRSAQGRIVWCANCEGNRTLLHGPAGGMVCSSCGSPNWIFLCHSVSKILSLQGNEIVVLNRLLQLNHQSSREEFVAETTRRAMARIRRAEARDNTN